MGRILPGPINYRVGYGFFKKKNNKKTQSGFELGLGFIHTRPEPRPGPDLFKGKILKYPNLYIYKSLKKNPTPLIPFHSAANPLTHITLLSHSTTLTLLTSLCSPQPLISVTTGHHVHLRSDCFLSFSQSQLTQSHTLTHSQFHSLSSSVA